MRQANIANTIPDAQVAGQFLGMVFFTLLPDRDGRASSVIPMDDLADRVSETFSLSTPKPLLVNTGIAQVCQTVVSSPALPSMYRGRSAPDSASGSPAIIRTIKEQPGTIIIEIIITLTLANLSFGT